MQQQQQDQAAAGGGGLFADLRGPFNVLTHAAAVAAFPAAVWTTRPGTWGDRYLGGWAAAGCLWPLVLAASYGPHPRAGDALGFWLATLFLLLAHGGWGVTLRKQGYRAHSRSWGESRLQRGGSIAAQGRARLLTGLLSLGAGLAASAAGSEPLGAVIVVSAGAKLFTDGLALQAAAARVRQAEDARFEGEFYAEEARGR